MGTLFFNFQILSGDFDATCIINNIDSYMFRPSVVGIFREVFSDGYITLLTPWCRVLLEKLTGLQLVKKLPAFHGT